jgi:hypothetical protein
MGGENGRIMAKKRQQATGNRERETGKRQQAVGSRERETRYRQRERATEEASDQPAPIYSA